jgi:hypothetical protein
MSYLDDAIEAAIHDGMLSPLEMAVVCGELFAVEG